MPDDLRILTGFRFEEKANDDGAKAPNVTLFDKVVDDFDFSVEKGQPAIETAPMSRGQSVDPIEAMEANTFDFGEGFDFIM